RHLPAPFGTRTFSLAATAQHTSSLTSRRGRLMKTRCLYLSVLALAACATEYVPMKNGHGYSDLQVSEKVFRVSFVGNGATKREQAEDYALMRSAQVAIIHGFEYFIIVSEQSSATISSYTTPTTTSGSATVIGNTVYGTATTIGGQTYIISAPS